jgi:hypothetical protein
MKRLKKHQAQNCSECKKQGVKRPLSGEQVALFEKCIALNIDIS